MTTLLKIQLKRTTQRILSTWILRIVGVSSVAIAIVNIAILFCRRFPPRTCQFIKKVTATTPSSQSMVLETALKRTSSSLVRIQEDKIKPPSPYARTPSTKKLSIKQWGLRLLEYAFITALTLKKKQKLTISMKNTLLWNPSQDIALSNHAFNEYAIPLLSRLCQRYQVYLLIHTNNDDERDRIQHLLASTIGSSPPPTPPPSSPTIKPSSPLLDKSRIIYCQDEATKLYIVQSVLCPVVHVEGGYELNDGENIIRGLKSSVEKIVWVMTRRRRASFNKDSIKPKDQDILADGLELTDSLLDSSLAREAGYFVD